MRHCLDLGSASLEDAAEWVGRVLENSGYRYRVRSASHYGRMIKIGLGLLRKAYLVRHGSIGKTIVCGPRDMIEALKAQGAITEYEPGPPAKDQRAEALIEAQILGGRRGAPETT